MQTLLRNAERRSFSLQRPIKNTYSNGPKKEHTEAFIYSAAPSLAIRFIPIVFNSDKQTLSSEWKDSEQKTISSLQDQRLYRELVWAHTDILIFTQHTLTLIQKGMGAGFTSSVALYACIRWSLLKTMVNIRSLSLLSLLWERLATKEITAQEIEIFSSSVAFLML